MCGRYTLRTPLHLLAQQFGLALSGDALPELEARYNIAPTQPVAAVRQIGSGGPLSQQQLRPERELVMLRWGLVPAWAKDLAIGNRLINARAETVAEKPAFRSAFRRRRCLVPADGYYEWRAGTKPKQPFFFHRPDDRPFAFAGLWEHWQPKGEGEAIESCTLVTTEPNPLAATVHDRMPAILDEADYATWLDPDFSDRAAVAAMLHPLPDDSPLVATPVSTYVNKPGNEGPGCLERASTLF